MTNICPKCQINFDHLHQRCVSMRFAKYLQQNSDRLWRDLGNVNLKVDRLEDQIEALQEENAKLRLRKNGVAIDSVKEKILLGELGTLGMSKEEVRVYLSEPMDGD